MSAVEGCTVDCIEGLSGVQVFVGGHSELCEQLNVPLTL